MYRQFLVALQDCDWQRILWRPSKNVALQEFRLKTVTYGEACAPFQANACMLRLADDEEERFPRGAAALRDSRYVDDIYVGEDSEEDLCITQGEVIKILDTAGMKAGKWASNSAKILKNANHANSDIPISLVQEQEAVSTLGLRWLPNEDAFNFKISTDTTVPKIITKRYLLSEISKLFDPRGFVSPVITRVKVLLQKLWLLKLSWDDPVPNEVALAWAEFKDQLLDLEKIKIPRWLGTYSYSAWELYGFSDALKSAYAAVLYVIASSDTNSHSKLLISKSKVAPIKV